jgi:hypothetical protein
VEQVVDASGMALKDAYAALETLLLNDLVGLARR